MGTMPHSYHVDLNLVEVTPKGSIEVDDILEYGRSLIDQGIMSRGTVEYVDMSEMTNLVIDYRSAQKLVQMLRTWIECGWVGSVFYAPQDPEFGIMRMVGALGGAITPDLGIPLIPRREPTALEDVRQLLGRPISSDGLGYNPILEPGD